MSPGGEAGSTGKHGTFGQLTPRKNFRLIFKLQKSSPKNIVHCEHEKFLRRKKNTYPFGLQFFTVGPTGSVAAPTASSCLGWRKILNCKNILTFRNLNMNIIFSSNFFSQRQCFGSGSGSARIRIKKCLLDPDPHLSMR